MKTEMTPGGLVIPRQLPEPKKEVLPLEFSDASSRKEAGQLFCKLRNMSGVRGGILDNRRLAKGRELAIMALAKQLLGEDWDCEILC